MVDKIKSSRDLDVFRKRDRARREGREGLFRPSLGRPPRRTQGGFLEICVCEDSREMHEDDRACRICECSEFHLERSVLKT